MIAFILYIHDSTQPSPEPTPPPFPTCLLLEPTNAERRKKAAASALVPLFFVAFTTSPFVSFIHIRLPPFARQSEEMLRRFVQNLPAKTELDFTTMSFIAKPRVSRVAVSELRPANKRLGIVNYTRDTAADNAARKWYMFPAVGNFSVQGNKMHRFPWAWESIASTIARQRI